MQERGHVWQQRDLTEGGPTSIRDPCPIPPSALSPSVPDGQPWFIEDYLREFFEEWQGDAGEIRRLTVICTTT